MIPGIVPIVAGIVITYFAKEISRFEKRLVDRFGWTKVTGWAGTPRGEQAWRLIGVSLMIWGAILVFLTLTR